MTSLTRTDSNNPDFGALTQWLDEELCRIYNTQQADYEEYNRITDLQTVVLAYQTGKAVACGCFKKFDENTIELKRMFVLPEFRGQGIASAIVHELQTWAVELGYKFAVLETGKKQPEAIAMYRKLGYNPIENFGQYENMELSICMKLKIA